MILNNISKTTRVIIILPSMLLILVLMQVLIPLITLMFSPVSDRQEMTDAEKELWRIPKAEKKFLVDGTIHLITSERDPFAKSSKSKNTLTIYNANDSLIWSGSEKDLPYNYVLHVPDYRRKTGKSFQTVLRQKEGIRMQFSRRFLVPVVSDERKILQRWFYDSKYQVFEGFDSNGEIIGCIGLNGFNELRDKVKGLGEFEDLTAWLPENSYSPIIFWLTKHKVYQINFLERSIETLFDIQDEEVERIEANNWFEVESNNLQKRPIISLFTKKGYCHLLLRQPRQQLKFLFPKKWFTRNINAVALADTIYIVHTGIEKGWNGHAEHERWIELHKLDTNSNLISLNRFEWTTPHCRYHPETEKHEKMSEEIKNCLTVASPVTYDLAWRLYYKKTEPRSAGTHRKMITELIRDFKPFYLKTSVAVSLAMACLAFLHGWSRRTNLCKLIFWVIFVGAFNLAGLLTYLALNHTTIIKCPACGKCRGLEKTECIRCGVVLPVPAKRKTDLILKT